MAIRFPTTQEARELAFKAYGEVLDATKHQDDKIGRFLTAIAFLFTGAIAFGTRSDLLDVRVLVDGRREALPALFLALFLTLSIVSVLLLIVAIGPNLSLPRDPAGGELPSWLYFLWIAGKTREEWFTQWEQTPATGAVTRSFIGEAHNLALKTEFKYNRTNEARAVFTLGLMFLALAIVLFFEASVRGEASTPLQWDVEVRVLTAAVVAVFAAALGYDQLRLGQDLGDYEVEGRRVGLVWPWILLVLAGPLYVASLLVLVSFEVGALIGVGIAVLMAHAALWLRRQERDEHWPSVAHAILVLLLLLSIFVVAIDSEWMALWLCVAAVVLLEVPRLAVASLKLHRRLSRIRPKASVTATVRDEWNAFMHERGSRAQKGAGEND
jgi:hypothetical protein